MPNTTSFEFGDVILVPFPFTDQTTTKKRPAVVISSQAYQNERPDLILMAITSQTRSRTTIGEITIKNWQEAGLIKPSVLKPLITTIEKTLVLRTMGKLTPTDQKSLHEALGKILGR